MKAVIYVICINLPVTVNVLGTFNKFHVSLIISFFTTEKTQEKLNHYLSHSINPNRGETFAGVVLGVGRLFLSALPDPLYSLLHFALFPRKLTRAEYISWALVLWLSKYIQLMGNTNNSKEEGVLKSFLPPPSVTAPVNQPSSHLYLPLLPPHPPCSVSLWFSFSSLSSFTLQSWWDSIHFH